jgi:tetratricopeptide (TPR) repeat protein
MLWYEKAASLDPGNPAFTAYLPLIHWEIGDDTEAKRLLDRMRMSGQGTAYSNFVAALLYLQRDEVEPARRHAQIAAELDPYLLFLVRNDDFRKRDYAGARARYAAAFPNLFEKELPTFNGRDAFAAIDLALVLQHTGEGERAKALLDRSEAYLRTIPRLGANGYGIADVAIHALRGDSALALVKLREAEHAGWRGLWRYYRDFDPNLASIRDEPEFKAIFADIERDMARQRAELAKRPKDAPLDLATGN